MAKYIIKEGLGEKFIRYVFSAVAARRKASLERVMNSDPQMKEYIRKLEAIKTTMEAYLAKHDASIATDPDWEKLAQDLKLA